MATNKLAGAGLSTAGVSTADGPSPTITGSLGNAPQAAPQSSPIMPPPTAANMLASAGQPSVPQQGAPTLPPKEKLIEAAHKQNIVVSHLRMLMAIPDLKTKDILSSVGDIIAEGVMTPFDAAKYLSDLPAGDADPLQLRKWVAQHYANAAQTEQLVSKMLAMSGQMERAQMPAPMPAANQLSGVAQ